MTRHFFGKILCSLLFACFCLSRPACSDTLQLYVRAFIPNEVKDSPGYVTKIKDAQGKEVFVINSPNPFEDRCYLTDQRGFSPKWNESSRVSAAAKFSIISNSPALLLDLSDTGSTSALTCKTGVVYCTDKASKSEINWQGPSDNGVNIAFPFDARASNPCIIPNGIAPKIFMKGSINLNKVTGVISISGDGSTFPSLEAGVVYEKSSPAVLLTLEASGGVSQISTSRPFKGEITLPIYDGIWKSNDPSGRFSLVVQGRDARLVERSATGSLLERTSKLHVDKGGLLTGYRENDREALAFLGFSPDIIAEVIKRNPKPSFITVKRNAAGIDLQWSGLLVTKDLHGKFKELKQPGDVQAKAFQLTK